MQKRRDGGKRLLLWTWARNTAWRHVGAVMRGAGISGPHATPKGLRHGFGVKAVTSGVPLHTLQQLLGDAHLSTTAIYADAQGPEQRQLVARMWRRPRTRGGDLRVDQRFLNTWSFPKR